MEVKPLVSVDTWVVHPVEYKTSQGKLERGLMICKSRILGVCVCHIIRPDGESINVPEKDVLVIQNTTRIRLSVTVLEK